MVMILVNSSTPPFGEMWVEEASTVDISHITRFFTNQQYDKESGLYYYNARYYDPHLGSFITPDPAMDGLNHYAYCSANPIRYTDPTGLSDDYQYDNYVAGIEAVENAATNGAANPAPSTSSGSISDNNNDNQYPSGVVFVNGYDYSPEEVAEMDKEAEKYYNSPECWESLWNAWNPFKDGWSFDKFVNERFGEPNFNGIGGGYNSCPMKEMKDMTFEEKLACWIVFSFFGSSPISRKDWFDKNNPGKIREGGKYGSTAFFTERGGPHNRVDLAKKAGTPVISTADGKVILAASNGRWGNQVIIDNGFEIKTFYSHLDTINVKVGDYIRSGEIIGTVGQTGFSKGPHLDYGVSIGGVFINPAFTMPSWFAPFYPK